MKRHHRIPGFCCFALLLLSVPTFAATTLQISTDATGGAPDGHSSKPAVSDDGRYVVFKSAATDLATGTALVATDTNGFDDIFVYDTQEETTTMVNLGYDGLLAGYQLNNHSDNPAISGDGRYVTFSTNADDVINYSGYYQIYVHDMQGADNNRVLVSARAGTSGGSAVAANGDSYRSALSTGGRLIAYESSATNLVNASHTIAHTGGFRHIYARDMQDGVNYLVSRNTSGANGGYANGNSGLPSISSDGEYIAFASYATDMVANTDNNGTRDIFVYDHPQDRIELISTAHDSSDAADGYNEFPHISGNGRYVAFCSDATNLVSGDTNDHRDVFLHDRQTGTTERVTLDPDGNEVTDGSYSDYAGGLSSDGRYVTFSSHSASLVEGDTNGVDDIFLRDMKEKKTVRVSIGNAGEEPNAYIYAQYMDVTADGLTSVFSTSATNLMGGNPPGTSSNDIYMRKDAYKPPFCWPIFLPAIQSQQQ